ncbi:MAG: hypothetical protein SO401_04230, partial [Blautia sp.]|nr:hypothetical protein [Blautia sp.]
EIIRDEEVKFVNVHYHPVNLCLHIGNVCLHSNTSNISNEMTKANAQNRKLQKMAVFRFSIIQEKFERGFWYEDYLCGSGS